MSSAESAFRIRVAISGIGMITPCGADRESSWQGLLSGKSAARWLTPDEHLARNCDPARTQLAGAPARLPFPAIGPQPFVMDDMARWMAREALVDAGLTQSQLEPARTGVVIGTSKGSLAAWHQLLTSGATSGQDPVALWNSGWPDSPARAVADEIRSAGPALVPVAACATGLLSILRGVQLIQDGSCDVVLAGSVDDSLSEILWASYRRLGVLARVKDRDPDMACCPYDRERTGFLMGSGGSIVVLERWDAARARGHRPTAEWIAGALLSDASALTQVSSDAAGLTRLIQDVLRRGQVGPGELDYLNLHGTGTRDNDRYETLGVRRALGSAAGDVACSSLKGTIGHLLGGAGSVEFAAMLLALRDQIVPPTANLCRPDPECDLDYTPLRPAQRSIRTALKLSLGFGGHLVAALVRAG